MTLIYKIVRALHATEISHTFPWRISVMRNIHRLSDRSATCSASRVLPNKYTNKNLKFDKIQHICKKTGFPTTSIESRAQCYSKHGMTATPQTTIPSCHSWQQQPLKKGTTPVQVPLKTCFMKLIPENKPLST